MTDSERRQLMEIVAFQVEYELLRKKGVNPEPAAKLAKDRAGQAIYSEE